MSTDLTSLDPLHPDGATETVPTLATYEKETRRDLKDWGGVEHQLNGGYHKFKFGNTAARPTTGVGFAGAGTIYINTQLGIVEYFDGVSWQTAIGAFPSGTRMLFDNDTAPTGWTRDTTINDVVITLVSGARVHGGSWTITGISADSHVLTTAEMPSHSHNTSSLFVIDNTGGLAAGFAAGGFGRGSNTTVATGGGGGHTHTTSSDGSWRPLKRDVIVCSKD